MNTAPLRLLLTLTVASVALWAVPAEARFGKRGDAHKAEKSEKKAQKKKATEASPASSPASPRPHAASPVASRPARGAHATSPVYGTPPEDHAGCCGQVVDTRPRYRSGVVVSQRTEVYGQGPSEPDRLHRFELFGSAQPAAGAAVLGVGMLADWTRVGLDFRFDQLLFAPSEPGGSVDAVSLFDAQLTLPLASNDRARLRGHLGISSAFAPDVIFAGPSGGLSASARLLGPLTLDASAQVTLIPYTRLDTRAGLGLRFGVLEVRGGMRLLALDDQGRVDGERHVDVLAGPYLAAGLVF